MNMEIPSDRSSQKPKFSLFRWWSVLSLPPDPPPEASFKQRDAARRAQLASILLFCFILVLIVVFVIYLVTNPFSPIFYGLLAVLGLMMTATFLNRVGRVSLAGFIISAGITLVVWGLILSSPLAPGNIGLFDILVYPVLFAASLLPVNWVFAWALTNSAFVVLTFIYAPHTTAMGQLLATSRVTIIERPIQVQILVSLVLWLWVRNAVNAIKRADRAEEISKLQRVVADQMLEKVNQKRQLDAEIQQIEVILDQSAMGHLDARVAHQGDSMLWSISGKLNNLISRFKRIMQDFQRMQHIVSQQQRFYLAEQRYQRLVRDLGLLTQVIQQAESRRQPLRLTPSGTPLDGLLQSMNGKYISGSPLESLPPSPPQTGMLNDSEASLDFITGRDQRKRNTQDLKRDTGDFLKRSTYNRHIDK